MKLTFTSPIHALCMFTSICLTCSHVQSEEAVSVDNVALKTKLEASREVERQQEGEITHLKEQLVQASSAQVNIHFWDLYCMYLFEHMIYWRLTSFLTRNTCSALHLCSAALLPRHRHAQVCGRQPPFLQPSWDSRHP